MIDIDLTNQQKQYLLYLSESPENETLTSIARQFNCSKVNSKKILDRMVKIGVIYKDGHTILLTDLGSKIAENQRDARNEIALVLEEGLSLDALHAKELATTMLLEESRGMRNHLLEVAKFFVKLERRQDDSLTWQEVATILGKGTFRAYFVIFQDETKEMKDSFTPLSMAMRGFEQAATITIDENNEGTFALRTRPIEKTHEGETYRGKPKIVVYRENGKEIMVPIGSNCILPFSVMKNWYYTGGGMLQTCIWLDMIPNIQLEHRHTAKFVFTLNLFNLT